MLRAMRSYASSSRDDRHLERPVELDQKQGGQQQPRHSKREGSELQGLRRAPVDPPVRRKSVDTRLKEQVSMQHFAAVKASVVAPGRDAPSALPGVPLPPVGERAAKAAAFVFRACDGTRSGTLLRWEFASAVEMMMRQKLVPYLIEQVRSLPAAASPSRAAAVRRTFAYRLTCHFLPLGIRSLTRRGSTPSSPRRRRAPTSAARKPLPVGSRSLTRECMPRDRSNRLFPCVQH